MGWEIGRGLHTRSVSLLAPSAKGTKIKLTQTASQRETKWGGYDAMK